MKYYFVDFMYQNLLIIALPKTYCFLGIHAVSQYIAMRI
jgi:hypothetical protein